MEYNKMAKTNKNKKKARALRTQNTFRQDSKVEVVLK